MELLFYICCFLFFGLIGWIIETIPKLLENSRYKKNLISLSSQNASIDIDKIELVLKDFEDRYNDFKKILIEKYRFSKNEKQIKSIYQYIQEESVYRAAKRKPKTISYAGRYRRKSYLKRRRRGY